MQAGGRTIEPQTGQAPGDRLDQRVAATPVDLPDAGDMAVVLAAFQEAGQHELRDGRTAQVTRVLGRHQVRVTAPRRDEPP